MKRVLRAIGLGLSLAMIPLTVLAAVSDVSLMTGNPTNNSIILTWVKPSDANTTLIRYKTTAYPANQTDGTLAYNGTSYQTTVSNLTAGQAYCFSAWGQNGSTYSTNSYNLTVSTLAVAIATGGASVSNITVPQGILPASMTQAPDKSGFQLQPFDGFISVFNNDPGGLGMPINNAWETLAIIGIVAGGIFSYTKVHNFFAAWAVSFVLTLFAVPLTLVQGWLIPIEIIFAMGVWAVDHYLQ